MGHGELGIGNWTLSGAVSCPSTLRPFDYAQGDAPLRAALRGS